MKHSTSLASLAALPLLLAGALTEGAPQSPCIAGGTLSILETAAAAGDFDTLIAAVDAAGLTETLEGPGPFTVFAPTDAAFAAIPPSRLALLLTPEFQDELTEILTYHVVAGSLDSGAVLGSSFLETVNGQRAYISTDSGARIQNAQILVTDIVCSNGIIHVIDAVIFPELRDVVQLARSLGRFDTLGAALQVADLEDALRGPGPFTVFAPTDNAFSALPPGAIEALLADLPALQNVLLYHVTSGRLYADQVLALGQLDMLNGDTTTISVMGGQAFIQDARIRVTDVQARNGVIHVIDAVLLP
jgi:transforming growth factor-beta-induced protein